MLYIGLFGSHETMSFKEKGIPAALTSRFDGGGESTTFPCLIFFEVHGAIAPGISDDGSAGSRNVAILQEIVRQATGQFVSQPP